VSVVATRRRQTVRLIVTEVPVETTYDLRRRVLRGGAADAEVAFPGDDVAGTFHLAVHDPGVVAIATFIPAPTPHREGQVTFQLRGMAVDDGRQGQGLGRVLLDAAAERMRAGGAVAVWAHARDSALGFYERLGWKVVGDGYVYGPMNLPHHLAIWDL